MIRLFLFFKRIAPFLLFVVLELVAFSVYFSQDSYQRAKMVAISNYLTGGIHSKLSDVSNYFNLSEQNIDLLKENAALQSEVKELKELLELVKMDSVALVNAYEFEDSKVVKVINNSYTNMNNYITIASGANQGIRPQMALFNSRGIVGYIKYCGENYSVAVSMLNRRDFRTSGMVQGKENSLGSICWDGLDYNRVTMEEIPNHSIIDVGDTVVTTEYSNIFPAGIAVGIVESVVKVTDVLKEATLSTMADMSSLDYLYAVELPYRTEREMMEEMTRN